VSSLGASPHRTSLASFFLFFEGGGESRCGRGLAAAKACVRDPVPSLTSDTELTPEGTSPGISVQTNVTKKIKKTRICRNRRLTLSVCLHIDDLRHVCLWEWRRAVQIKPDSGSELDNRAENNVTSHPITKDDFHLRAPLPLPTWCSHCSCCQEGEGSTRPPSAHFPPGRNCSWY
jgi:hypothetical protein